MLRETLRVRHYSLRTEQQYVNWVRRFLRFHHHRHPREMGAVEVSRFLTHLAVEDQVSASTQNQALSALLFLYRDVLMLNLPWLDEVVRARTSRHLPVVLTRQEVAALLAQVDGLYALQLRLLYGTGMRLMECMRLRVKDIDFGRGEILIRDGKGAKDRVTMLPQSLVAPLQTRVPSTRQTCKPEWLVCFYPMRWHENTLMPGRNGAGNMCLSPRVMCAIHALAHNGGTIRMKSCCSER
ncbi:phage integrase N-terminal SAM-like domain-containing protein [Laribacter hongkongensis]|uniref:phage integrase N-terminal SAM-like domain-containing protein n=1 Tax=Laribacter hongkongensis TaxID=168471 RepID=UPI0027E40082|nr:phage integrase N-terminal SAM-like domain-containing protein [Laribacter hongkongensis]MCG9125164.1 phage integrase N-terminal SAM-like domain-containing protein [Laribacter hongkongensis]